MEDKERWALAYQIIKNLHETARVISDDDEFAKMTYDKTGAALRLIRGEEQ